MGKALTILVVEDDPNDALLLKLAFVEAGVSTRLHFAWDGKEAIDYLQTVPPFRSPAKHPLPNLLVLDLKMSHVSGFEVLEWLRQRPSLKPIPVVVLSGSHWQEDIDRAYALGANFYITKPVGFQQLVGVVERLKEESSLHLTTIPPTHLAKCPRRLSKHRTATEAWLA